MLSKLQKLNIAQRITLTLWFAALILYGVYQYYQEIDNCVPKWLPMGLDTSQALNLCYGGFLHYFFIFFVISSIIAFIFFKIWDKNQDK